MSNLSEALKGVGFKPTPQRKPTLRAIARAVLAPITRKRKLIVQKAGGFVRVRWEGQKNNCFGLDIAEAKQRLHKLD